ncbi:MAG: ribosome-binding factor A [Magnetococcales bacterium]|nr:ribosome-binding factor A [Magnetococcales bacterium]
MKHMSASRTGSGGRIRTERVRASIRQEIADMLLRQEIHDPRLVGFISITDVRLSTDLQYATVYFSVVDKPGAALEGGNAEPESGSPLQPSAAERERLQVCQQALTHAAGFIRGQLGRRIQLRQTPHLRFLPDHSLDYGLRMNQLLGSLQIPPADEAESLPAPPPAATGER